MYRSKCKQNQLFLENEMISSFPPQTVCQIVFEKKIGRAIYVINAGLRFYIQLFVVRGVYDKCIYV